MCDVSISKRFSIILCKLFIYSKMSQNEKLNEIIKNYDRNNLLARQEEYLSNIDESLSLQKVLKDLCELHLSNVYIVTFPN
jgi:hypothetical protein